MRLFFSGPVTISYTVRENPGKLICKSIMDTRCLASQVVTVAAVLLIIHGLFQLGS